MRAASSTPRPRPTTGSTASDDDRRRARQDALRAGRRRLGRGRERRTPRLAPPINAATRATAPAEGAPGLDQRLEIREHGRPPGRCRRPLGHVDQVLVGQGEPDDFAVWLDFIRGGHVRVRQRFPDILGSALDVGDVDKSWSLRHAVLCSSLDIAQAAQTRALELVDPSFLDLVQGHRVEVVELVPAAPDGADQVCGLENIQVLGERLASHVHVLAELAQRLSAALVKPVQQVPPSVSRGIGQCLHLQIRPDGTSIQIV